MGSRLKGKRASKKTLRDRRALIKVLMYGAIGLVVIGLLWAAWYSKTGMMKAESPQRKAPAEGQAAGP